MNVEHIIEKTMSDFSEVRYVAIYQNGALNMKQRNEKLPGASSSDSDRYEELLVNPTLLKLATQRGDIDCGGLDFLVIHYGHFHQVVRTIPGGHVSVCLEKDSDLNALPQAVLDSITSGLLP